MMTISLINVSVVIDDRSIIKDLTLDVEPGALVGIIGPNGAGKTTLAKTIVGLSLPTSGSVDLLERPLPSYSNNERAKIISYLPQDAPAHWPISVREVVALGRFAYQGAKETKENLDRAVEGALRATDALDLKDRSISNLSGGEYARVMLARALVANAPVLLVDEPIASLDPYHQIHVMEILRQYADQQKTVLAILHDLTLAGRFCDRLVLMKDGEIISDGSADEVLRQDVLEDAYDIRTVGGEHQGEKYVVPWRRRKKTETEPGKRA